MADDANHSLAGSAARALEEAYDRMLEADTRPVPASYRRHAPIQSGPTLVPVERYISRRFHELEVEKLWKRVWQMACHEDDLPGVGDYLPYDIAGLSFLIVRTGPDAFKAYHNACLHRGRKLREAPGRLATELRCQFHGWTWSLDGRLIQVPCLWDFPELKREEQALEEVKVARWGRFIFINPDPDCEPFEDFIGDLSSHFEVLPYERRYKEAHVAKVIRANWKVAHEAFMESYHVIATHPMAIDGGIEDLEGKYDVFGNYSRAIRVGSQSGGTPTWDPLPDDGVLRMIHPLNGWVYERVGEGKGINPVRVTTPTGGVGLYAWDGACLEGELGDASLHLCNWVGGPQMADDAPALTTAHTRKELASVIPSIIEDVADIEFSAVYLSLFPNFDPWGSFNKLVYRFRPNGDKHEESIMEVIYLAPIPEDGRYTPNRDIHWLGPDDDWIEAPELGLLAKLFNQDVANMQFVQQGLHATRRTHIQLSHYNETKIRHFHQLLEDWVGRG